MDAPIGSIIAYSTAPGTTASDGKGINGLYTSSLLKYIIEPEISIEEAFKQVRVEVVNQSDGQQTPWESTSLMGEFQFYQNDLFIDADLADADQNIPETPPPTIKEESPKLRKHSILYSAGLPILQVGIKYHFGKRLGGYICLRTGKHENMDYASPTPVRRSYFFLGLSYQVGNIFAPYVGGGYGSTHYQDAWSGTTLPLEFGSLIRIKKFVLDVGAGYMNEEALHRDVFYVTLGLGYSF